MGGSFTLIPLPLSSSSIPQMLLSTSHHHLPLSTKTLDSPSQPFLPKPSLHFRNPKPQKHPIRASATTNPQTLAKSAIRRITDKLRNLGYIEETTTTPSPDRPPTGPGSAGEIFIPTPQELPNHRVGHTLDSSWSTPEQPVPLPGAGIARFHDAWKDRMRPRRWPAQMPSVAELKIPGEELKRLRTDGIRLEKRLKVGKAGITEGIVNGIHERWRRSEVVKIKCEDLCRMNMKRTHEILERKTGGLVIWRSGSIIVLYRGTDYKYPYFNGEDQVNVNLDEISSEANAVDRVSDQQEGYVDSIAAGSASKSPNTSDRSSLVIGVGSPKKLRFQLPGESQLEEEAESLLDGLGPRFTDWWGCDPLPVDADLLPAIVPGFRKPFRLLPFGVKPKLTDREMTILRRLGRPLPCHFALGRNRNLQGLAASVVKLWEKCEIVKIAVKRGVQNTNSEIMAEELKRLTGGTLLSRDKEFIVFYRGKDFLPPAVSVAIEERRRYETSKQKQNISNASSAANASASEPEVARSDFANKQEETDKKKSLLRVKRLTSKNFAIKRVETKLSEALEKKEKAERLLEQLVKSAEPSIVESDREAISKEERYMLRKVGLRMKAFLLLGRRGVFDGTVENMHLHWKYRELVKIICKDRCIEHVHDAARTLEAESGGILVAVERVSKGHAIIVYRGKNYQRPETLRPKTLLGKREAMKRSLEAQRRQSLKLHILSLSRNIDQLKDQMAIDASEKDSVQVIQPHTSSVMTETNENIVIEECNIITVEYVHQKENFKEVHEPNAEPSHSTTSYCSLDTGETANMPVEDKLMASTHHDFSETGVVHSDSEPRINTSISNNEVEYVFSESAVNPEICQQSHISSSASNYISCVSDEGPKDLSFGSTSRSELPVHDKFGEFDGVPFKAANLSNRERLVLRKQALKMKKRPVLAVGRSNMLTGVVKTIKTHFKKHPLAIVNIKGRAKGTSVQEVIFELEQATGAVLVSREPSKVILYRGWGEGELPGEARKKDSGKASGSEMGASPQLMAAIRRECGLQTSRV